MSKFAYLMGLLTAALIAAPFVWSTPNLGWRPTDEPEVRLKYNYVDRALISVSVAVPEGVEVTPIYVRGEQDEVTRSNDTD